MSKTFSLSAKTPTTQFRRRGHGNTYQQKRNHSSGSNDNENQHFIEEQQTAQPIRGRNSNRKAYKRGRGRFYSNHKSSEHSYNESTVNSIGEPEFVQQNNPDQEACNLFVNRCNNNSSKKPVTSRNLSSQSCYKDQPVSDSSFQDKNVIDNILSKPPTHSKNSIFVGELASRFNSILPPSTILSSEGHPQQILSNQDNLKTSNHDYELPTKNKMQQCLNENNPHYPFLHCNMGSGFKNAQESQSNENKYSTFKHNKKSTQRTSSTENINSLKHYQEPQLKLNGDTYSKSGHKQKRSQQSPSTSSTENINSLKHYQEPQLKLNEDTYSKSGHKQKRSQQSPSTTSAENKSVKEIMYGSKHNKWKSRNNNAHQGQPDSFLSGDRDMSHNQNENMGDILFSQIDEFALNQNSQNNNKSNIHQTDVDSPEQDLFSQIRAFVAKSRATKHETSTETRPNAEDVKGNYSLRTSRKHVMEESTSSLQTKSEQTQPFGVEVHNTNNILERRNEVLKSFGFKGKSVSQENLNKQGKVYLNPSKSTVSHQEQVSETKISSTQFKGNSSVESSLHSQQESFKTDNSSVNKKIEVPSTNNNRNRSNVSHQYSRNVNNSSSPYEFPKASHSNSQQNQLLSQRDTLNKLQPEINRSGNEINISNCTNQSTLSRPNKEFNNAKVTGGNRYNIHRPVNDSTQRVPSRIETVRRLQDEYAGQLVDYQRKELEKEAKKREKKLARYQYVDQGHRLTEGYLDEAVGGYELNDGPFIESEEEVRRRQQEQFDRDAVIYQDYEQQKNEKLRKREEEKKKKELEKYKYVSPGNKLGGNDNTGRQGAPILQNLSQEQVRQRQQEKLKRDALIHEEQEKKNYERLKQLEEDKKKKEMEKYKHVNTGYRLDYVGGARRKTRSPQHDSAEVSKQDSQLQKNPGDSVGGAKPKTRSPQHSSTETSKENSHPQKNLGGPIGGVQDKDTLDDSSQSKTTTINNIDATFLKFLQTNGVLNQAATKDAEELRLTLLSQLQNVLVNANKTSVPKAKDTSLGSEKSENERNITPNVTSTGATEKSTSFDSSIKPASYVVKSAGKGPILVLRPSQEALQSSISHHIGQQDLDKHGESALYKPHVEQAPIYSNNRFDQKATNNTCKLSLEQLPQVYNRVEQRDISNVFEAHSSKKSLDEEAKSSGTIPKQNQSVDNLQAPSVNSSSTSLNESEMAEINYEEELRTARLRMQKRYDEAIKNQVN